MDAINLSKSELYSRGGVLDQLVDNIFDVSILVDADCKILKISNKAFHAIDRTTEVVGQDITVLDAVSPFREVIRTGKSHTGLLLEIYGRKCISSIYPIEDDGKIIGAMGMITFRDLKRIKRIFADADASDRSLGEIYDLVSKSGSGYAFEDFIGEDPTVKDLIEKAEKSAASKLPILIIGETGTGKEIISAAIHGVRSAITSSPYVTINCTAIPENLLESELFGHEKGAFTGADQLRKGKFEAAAGGDILLDEIGDMNLNMQGKLLRVLESREFERVGGSNVIPLRANIIASTNKNLYVQSEEKKFRADLYYRLNAIELFVPPLRIRNHDIPLLIDHFSQELDVKLHFTSDAINLLMDYPWPGNVRQLRNLVQRLSIFYADTQITASNIEGELRIGQRTYNEAFGFATEGQQPPIKAIDNSERSAIIIAMKNNNNNISAAARELGISRGTLYSKLKKYDLR